MDTASPRLRMSVVGVVVIGCFVALFARLWYLQVMEAPQLEVQATQNRTRTVAVEAPRGRILDRNGVVIVDNRTSLVVTIDRRAHNKLPAADRDALVSKLAATFTEFGTLTKTDAIEKRLADLQYDDLQPVPVATDISQDLMVYLAEHADEFPNVRRRARVRPRLQGEGCRGRRGRRQHPRVRRAHHQGEARRRRAGHRPRRRGEGVPARLHHRPGRHRGGLREGPAGHPGHRGARDRRQEPPGGPAVVPGAAARQRHPAQHRHQRADEGRGGPARAAQRGARWQSARQLRRAPQERPGRGLGRHRPQHGRGDRPGHLPDLRPRRSSSTASARSATPSSPTPTASAPCSTAPSAASTPPAPRSSWSPPPPRSTTARSAPASTSTTPGCSRSAARSSGSTGKNGPIQMATGPHRLLRRVLLHTRVPDGRHHDDPGHRGGLRLRRAHRHRPAQRVRRVRVHPRREEGPAREVPGGLPRRHLLVHRRQRPARHRPERRGRHPGAAGRRLLGPGQRRHRLPAPRGGPGHEADHHPPAPRRRPHRRRSG